MNAARTRAAKHSHDQVNEWATWGVRIVLVALGSFIVYEVRNVQAISEDVAVLKATIDSHGKQIDAIWHRLSDARNK